MQITTVPLWLDASDFAEIMLQTEHRNMQYSVALYEGWNKNISASIEGAYPEQVFNGKSQADWLVISYMDKAVAGHNMENWVNVILNTAGFPCAQMSALNPAPVLVAWKEQPSYDAFLQKKQCDEMLCYMGSALVAENHSRLFLLMLRKQNLAWKIFLSINSNWGYNDDEINCLLQDNIKASRVFGSLVVGNFS